MEKLMENYFNATKPKFPKKEKITEQEEGQRFSEFKSKSKSKSNIFSSSYPYTGKCQLLIMKWIIIHVLLQWCGRKRHQKSMDYRACTFLLYGNEKINNAPWEPDRRKQKLRYTTKENLQWQACSTLIHRVALTLPQGADSFSHLPLRYWFTWRLGFWSRRCSSR